MHKENENRPQVTDLIAWAKNVQEWEPASIAESLNEAFEAYIHTNFADAKEERCILMFNINLVKKGMLLLSDLDLDLLDDAEKILTNHSNV